MSQNKYCHKRLCLGLTHCTIAIVSNNKAGTANTGEVTKRRAGRHAVGGPLMDRTPGFRRSRLPLAFAASLATLTLATPALADAETSTRLVRCGEESCVRVAGYRTDPSSAVRINGRTVSVEGKRSWKIDLPVDVIREWSEPNARTISVSFSDTFSQFEETSIASLPIGLLSDASIISSIEFSVR
jgi:hypothetical protein